MKGNLLMINMMEKEKKYILMARDMKDIFRKGNIMERGCGIIRMGIN